MGCWEKADLSGDEGVDSGRRPRSDKQIESELQRLCRDLTGLSASVVAASEREGQGDDIWAAGGQFEEGFKAALHGIRNNQPRSVGDLIAVGKALQSYLNCGGMDPADVATISRILIAGVMTVLNANNAF
jgi:hypothetical protein